MAENQATNENVENKTDEEAPAWKVEMEKAKAMAMKNPLPAGKRTAPADSPVTGRSCFSYREFGQSLGD